MPENDKPSSGAATEGGSTQPATQSAPQVPDLVTTPRAGAANPEFSVFVSYKVGGDAILADGVAELIRNSFSNPPSVFVSDSGGLVPSSKSMWN
jgi:hypothetical protein